MCNFVIFAALLLGVGAHLGHGDHLVIVPMDNVFVHGPVCATILQRRVVDPNVVVPVLIATRRDVVRHMGTVEVMSTAMTRTTVLRVLILTMMVWTEVAQQNVLLMAVGQGGVLVAGPPLAVLGLEI